MDVVYQKDALPRGLRAELRAKGLGWCAGRWCPPQVMAVENMSQIVPAYCTGCYVKQNAIGAANKRQRRHAQEDSQREQVRKAREKHIGAGMFWCVGPRCTAESASGRAHAIENKSTPNADTCKDCAKAYVDKARDRNLSLRQTATAGGGCTSCGKRGPLEHHHALPENKRGNVSQMLGAASLKAELAKTILLCPECHTRETEAQEAARRVDFAARANEFAALCNTQEPTKRCSGALCRPLERHMPCSAFYKDSSKADGLETMCKACSGHKLQQRRKRDREYVFQRKLAIASCIDCALAVTRQNARFFEFDHIVSLVDDDAVSDDKHKKVKAVSDLYGAPRARLDAEIAKCVLRCKVCHRKRTAAQLGHWRTLGF